MSEPGLGDGVNLGAMRELELEAPLRPSQTRMGSLAEAVVNTCIGYAIAYFASWIILNWWMKMDISHSQMNWYTGFMTIISVVRSYYVRRMWEMQWWKRLFRK